ncbi:hypothetical protein ACFRMQ_14565 [Kitasatospora sp. NPDC056783]|uniref:hypothetical protein n=1 Tax=Kitasatospora sp. NPDC056783 TaxID=3345943 RepID=UPI0036CAFD2E
MDEGQKRFLKHCLILGTGAAAGWISHLGPALSHSIEAVSVATANSWYGVGLGTAYTAAGWLIDVRLRDGTRAADVRTKTGIGLVILVRAPFATALTALVLYSPGPFTTHL